MTEQEIRQIFSELTVDIDDLQFVIQNRPLLAHYTSIEILEKIMTNDELWLSNPLFMNDLEEVRFGMQQGVRLFLESQTVAEACGSPTRHQLLAHAFMHYYNQFDQEHAFDIYVFCLSQHDPANPDGLLSMWRGYGGQGNGAALVFNTHFVEEASPASTPLILTKVLYASAEKRIEWLQKKLMRWCEIFKSIGIPDDQLHIAAYALFYTIKFFALKSKHDGFKEECEWRIIYMPEPDGGVFKEKIRFHYVNGKRGVEPKLVLKITPLQPSETWTFFDILGGIILGPSLSSWLARRSVACMLEAIGKPEFRQKVSASRIPLRPSN